ncbi:MAG: MarR family winged helix-turn-helix transcriptional regulator [Dehalococcoidia bacterium]
MSSAPAISEHAVDAAIRHLGDALAIFDPLRFRAWAELGLTTAQLRVMFLVRETPGVTAGELATRLSVTPPTISGIVDRLVKLGLVRREDDLADRRLVRNHLTEAGDAACGRLEKGGDIFTRRILIEMDHHDLEYLLLGLKALVRAADYISRVEPDLAVVAMPGANL